jgi:TRAP transporter 4TM/12TM fusion protein
VVRWKGASLERALSHQWLTTQGVFGIALGVSTSFVFLFVLFGALLEAAGAGNYFIKLAFALLGHLRGGPAKAAVLGSALTGLISGSSIANVVTTGTFTIPLMRRVGFTSEKAGAVEVASSVNGQLTPPVMGAAAFLIMDSVGMTYTEVITHALLPAVISYIALFYIVHLEAVKQNMPMLSKPAAAIAKGRRGDIRPGRHRSRIRIDVPRCGLGQSRYRWGRWIHCRVRRRRGLRRPGTPCRAHTRPAA